MFRPFLSPFILIFPFVDRSSPSHRVAFLCYIFCPDCSCHKNCSSVSSPYVSLPVGTFTLPNFVLFSHLLSFSFLCSVGRLLFHTAMIIAFFSWKRRSNSVSQPWWLRAARLVGCFPALPEFVTAIAWTILRVSSYGFSLTAFSFFIRVFIWTARSAIFFLVHFSSFNIG